MVGLWCPLEDLIELLVVCSGEVIGLLCGCQGVRILGSLQDCCGSGAIVCILCN